MSTNKVYREIVQDGLDRRAAERRDAALEAQARKLRLIINANHTAKLSKLYPSEQPERRQEEARAEAERLKRKQEARAQRAAEASYCTDWYSFMLRIFAPLFIAAATIGLCNTGVLPCGLAATGAICASMFGIHTFVSWFAPKEGNAE